MGILDRLFGGKRPPPPAAPPLWEPFDPLRGRDPEHIPFLGPTLRLEDRRPEATPTRRFTDDYPLSVIERVVRAAQTHKVDPNLLLAMGMQEGNLKDFSAYDTPRRADTTWHPLENPSTLEQPRFGKPATDAAAIRLERLYQSAQDAAARLRSDLDRFGSEPRAVQAYNGKGWNPVTREHARDFPYFRRVDNLRRNMMQASPELQALIRALEGR